MLGLASSQVQVQKKGCVHAGISWTWIEASTAGTEPACNEEADSGFGV